MLVIILIYLKKNHWTLVINKNRGVIIGIDDKDHTQTSKSTYSFNQNLNLNHKHMKDSYLKTYSKPGTTLKETLLHENYGNINKKEE